MKSSIFNGHHLDMSFFIQLAILHCIVLYCILFILFCFVLFCFAGLYFILEMLHISVHLYFHSKKKKDHKSKVTYQCVCHTY